MGPEPGMYGVGLLLASVAVLRGLLWRRQRTALRAQPETAYALALLDQRTVQQLWQMAWVGVLATLMAAGWPWTAALGGWPALSALLVAGWLWELPARTWKSFVTDARHGVNRLGVGRFLREQWVALLLFAALAVPAAKLSLLILADRSVRGWWLLALLGWLGLVVLREVKPQVQARLFERLQPLPAGPLRDRLQRMLARLGLGQARWLVLQVSARSTQANAQARGTRRRPRVVLHDTLLAQLPDDEVEAVAAHELGHVRLGHLRVQRWLLGACVLPAVLAAGAVTAGFADPVFRLALAWALLPSLWLFALPVLNAHYRRWEFEADACAAGAAGAAAMAAALRQLTRHNANAPQPDVWYERIYHTHPAVAARLARLETEAPAGPVRSAGSGRGNAVPRR